MTMILPFFIWRKPDVRPTDLTKKESSGRIYSIGTIDKPIWPYENPNVDIVSQKKKSN